MSTTSVNAASFDGDGFFAAVFEAVVEEAGVSGRHWHSLESFLSSPGIFTEVLHLFLATGIEPAVAALEKAEVLEVHWMPFAEAYEWAVSGKIRDGKTAIGLVRAHYVRSKQS